MALLSDLMTLGMPARIAVVVALLGFIGAALATLIPASANGVECGTWISPDWTEDRTRELVDRAGELGTADGLTLAARAATAARECDETLDGRRNLAAGLAGLAVIGPAAVGWVTRGSAKDRDPRQSARADRPT